MRSCRAILVLLATLACRPRPDAAPAASADTASADTAVPTSTAAGRPPASTPGFCGPWGTTDSTALATCARAGFTNPPPGLDSLLPGDCGFEQTVSVARMEACLHRVDSAATLCPAVGSFRLRQADGVTRAAEWRRCGPQGGAFQGDSAVWPLHFLLLHADSAPTSPLIFAYSNQEEPGSSGLDTVAAVDLDRDGTDELFYLEQIYGTGSAFEHCALVVRAGKLRCWLEPGDELPRGALLNGEELMKGWVPSRGAPADSASGPLRIEPNRSLWFSTPVYRNGDPNCCGSAGASLWSELVARNGRFEHGLFIRAREDSLGNILGTDTLRR